MVKRWLRRYGREETERLMTANNDRPSMALRINRLRIEPAAFKNHLSEQQIIFSPSAYLPHFVRVKTLSRIGQMDLFRNGMFTIQDESAGLPCQLLDAQPGERVFDMCAAPGGKTTYLSEMMNNEGVIFALDKYDAKLAMIRGSAERLGLRNIQLRATDALTFQESPADRILLDAPCSGLGTLAKKPDMKWKRDQLDIAKLVTTQRAMLENAARLLRPGGVLVYSTCTIEPEENEDLIAGFLEVHPEFHIDPAGQFVHPDLVTPGGWIATFPHRHGMDGSFAVRLSKSALPAA